MKVAPCLVAGKGSNNFPRSAAVTLGVRHSKIYKHEGCFKSPIIIFSASDRWTCSRGLFTFIFGKHYITTFVKNKKQYVEIKFSNVTLK
jgi:hypothetical protein